MKLKAFKDEVFDYRIRDALNDLKELNESGRRTKYGNRKNDEQQMRNSIKYFMDKNEKYYKKYKSYQKNNKVPIKISKMIIN